MTSSFEKPNDGTLTRKCLLAISKGIFENLFVMISFSGHFVKCCCFEGGVCGSHNLAKIICNSISVLVTHVHQKTLNTQTHTKNKNYNNAHEIDQNKIY